METLAVIPSNPLVGVNYSQPVLHTPKRMLHFYSTDESIIQFVIGYMINPSLKYNKVFREQVENSEVFHFIKRQWKLLNFF